jgi:hypothetical protein
VNIFGPLDKAIGPDGKPCEPTGRDTAAPGYIDSLEVATHIATRK